MKIKDILSETATAGGTSAGAVASVANPVSSSKKSKKSKKKPVKNALDSNGSIFAVGGLKR